MKLRQGPVVQAILLEKPRADPADSLKSGRNFFCCVFPSGRLQASHRGNSPGFAPRDGLARGDLSRRKDTWGQVTWA